jgi:transposase
MREGRGRYTEAMKRHVVREVEAGRISQAEASLRYGILGHSTILKWCRRYGHEPTNRTPGLRVKGMNEQEIELLQLQNEIKELKRELEGARFKNIVLETLVDVAERELKIPIRKKYGAKRSTK